MYIKRISQFFITAGLVAQLVTPAIAQDSAANKVYLPITQRPFQPEMRIAHFTGARADECLSSMGAVGPAAAAAICPLPGNYFALADGAQIAIGGRQNGADVGWASLQGSYTLIRPTQLINDADVVAIDVAGQYSNDTLFGTSAGGFKVIRHSYTTPVVAAGANQMERAIGAADFAEAMRGLYSDGHRLTASLTAGVVFWDDKMTSSFTARQCGFDKATWYFGGRIRFVFTVTGMTFLVGGNFTDPVLNRCMGIHRYVDAHTLMVVPEAVDIQTSVREFRRGQTPFVLEWVSVPGGATYGFWSAVSGGVAYYAYVTLNSAKQVIGTTFFIAIPDPYKLECMAQEAVGKQCVVLTP